MALLFLIVASMHYHVCLDSDVCLTTLARAGSWDYALGYFTGALIVLQVAGLPADHLMANLIFIAVELIFIVDDLYSNYWSFLLLTGTLLLQTVFVPLFMHVRSTGYRNPIVKPFLLLTTVVSYVLIALPLQPGSLWYSVTHPVWHLASAAGLALLEVIDERPIIGWFDREKWAFEYRLRSRSEMMREAAAAQPYSDLLL